MRRSGHRMYARRSRRTGRVVAVLLLTAGVAALIAAGATLIPSWLGSGSSTGAPTPTPKARACPTARLPGSTRLGELAWVRDGALSRLELESCKERTLVQTGGTEAGHVAFSPNGRSLAIDVGGDRVEMVDVADGGAVTIYRVTPRTKARPEVAGWSPDGRWVLFFSRFAGKKGVPRTPPPPRAGPGRTCSTRCSPTGTSCRGAATSSSFREVTPDARAGARDKL